ncbi:CobW family GTP-binding protein [Gordonia soli]|uniref:CobW C-terminal domain-containing protein n=1 Tax=Gordonia soli NBRC 108243 TaxID=1223545 RepID=M0QD35_9ACTN|nr:GTP-binding protein [Gordonia soli]GAC66523.1 hypothetical protein GS4_02_02340 [Gordonia soli NBRC 108243]
MTPSGVPVIVLAGFLGSGKTTLLNHLLRTSRMRIGVLINDFGAINIDALLIAGQADGTVNLGNGCICCSVDADGLEDTLLRLTRPRAGIDAVVIEASGIAEPRTLIRMVTAIADARIRYGGLVYVVDAVSVSMVRDRHPEIDHHVSVADLIVVNKADLVEPPELERVGDLVRSVNPTAPRVVTIDGALDPAVLFDPVERVIPDDVGPRQLTLDELVEEIAHDHSAGDGADSEGDHSGHLHAAYTSVEFTSAEPMDPRALAAVLERPPVGSYRIKGVVSFDLPGHRQRYVVHAVGGFVRVDRGPWRGEQPSTALVVIGTGLDADDVRRRLSEAVRRTDTTDEHGILSITRHLPDAG